jgi:hypothetical protein
VTREHLSRQAAKSHSPGWVLFLCGSGAAKGGGGRRGVLEVPLVEDSLVQEITGTPELWSEKNVLVTPELCFEHECPCS